jgi:hypothetical protein
MHRRSIRITLLTILLAGGVAAGLFLGHLDRRAADLRAADADVSARVARLTDALVDAAAAQHAYVTPGQGGEPWFERMSVLIRQLYDETSALSGQLHSDNAHATVEGLTAGIEALVASDTRVRENLRLGQALMAADVIFSDSRNTIDTMLGRLRELRAAEAQTLEAAHGSLTSQRWLALGATAVLWLGGLAFLVLRRSSRTADAAQAAVEIAPAGDVAVESARTPAVDLTAAAALCVDLSRVTTAAALPDLLGRAAAILDAPGIILWMAAGEELFAVTAHGYPEQVLVKVGPLARRTDNATAAAWREGRMVTVAGAVTGNAAIVAPLFGPDNCIGVLAVEVRRGGDTDPAAQAVVTMFAAQLATIVSAWPAASSGELRAEASA